MNTMLMLAKREFWEHRSLWIAPLVWVGILLFLFSWLVFIRVPHIDHDVNKHVQIERMQDDAGVTDSRSDHKHADESPPSKRSESGEAFAAFSYLGIWGLISTFACVVVFFYLIDCLFTERRDRSILFWKSLPVSDAQVVLSKILVALVAVPIGMILLTAATHLIMYLMVAARFHGSPIADATLNWNFINWLRSLGIVFVVTVGGLLWYAPIAAYFLLLSAWARRLVFLWAVVPLIAIPLLELFFFHTGNVAHFIGMRFGGFMQTLHVDPNAFNSGDQHGALPRVQDVFDSLHLSGLFTSVEMWIGLAAAAAMVYAAIRIRRYRDDA